MAAIFGETKIFQNWDNYSAEIPCGSKISSKLLYLVRFSRYKHFCEKFRKFKMAAIFGETKIFSKLVCENFKIQNGRHFGRDKNFLKIGKTTPQRYPAGQKFRRNRSI